MKTLFSLVLLLSTLSSFAGECRIVRDVYGNFKAYSGNKPISDSYSRAETAVQEMNKMYNYRMCDSLPRRRDHLCEIKRDVYGNFSAYRDGKVFSHAYSNVTTAGDYIEQMKALNLCERYYSNQECKIKRDVYGNYFVKRGSQELSHTYSNIETAFEVSVTLEREGLCLAPIPRGGSRPPRRDHDHGGNRRDHRSSYADFRINVLDLSEGIIRIVESLEVMANNEERVSILTPIKKQAARLSARIESGSSFERVKNTLIHLDVLLGNSEAFINETLERDGSFRDAKDLLTFRLTIQNLTNLMREVGNNNGSILY